MQQEDYKFFQEHGYLPLGKILTAEEVAYYTAIFDRDWAEERDRWYPAGNHQMINCDALVSSPELDGIIRHAKIIKPLHTLMGEEICFSEICIRHMAAYESPEAATILAPRSASLGGASLKNRLRPSGCVSDGCRRNDTLFFNLARIGESGNSGNRSPTRTGRHPRPIRRSRHSNPIQYLRAAYGNRA